MKFTKTSWLILSVGIFVIAFSSLGVARSQQIGEQNQVYEELSIAELRLSNFQLDDLSSQQEELEKQLSQTISQLETTKTKLSQPTESIAASDALFDIAKSCDVEVTEISSSGPASGNLEGLTCSILPLTAKVEGETYSLIKFITKLNDDFTTGVVKVAELSIPETTCEDRPSAYIQMVIYTYQGD